MSRKLLFTILICFTFQTTFFAQHDWKQTNPGGGGAIATVGATANGLIVAASDLSGIYVSSNNGESWSNKGATQGLTETHISSLGFHGTDGNTFIIGTGIGAFKTTDGGNNIYPVQIETSPSKGLGYVESIGMAFANPNIGYMAHYEWWEPEISIVTTSDAGENWTKKSHNLPSTTRITKILVDKNNDNLVYALAGKARFGCSDPFLYKSTDAGTNWNRIGIDLGPILDFDLHPTDPEIVFVSTFEMNENGCDTEMWQYPNNNGELYKSLNGGDSFSEIGAYGGIISVNNDPDHITVTDVVSVADWNGNTGTWETMDGGSTWNHTGLYENWYYGWSTESFAFTVSFNGLNKSITKDQFHPERLYSSFAQSAWSSIDNGKTLNNISTKHITGEEYLTTGLENIEGNAFDVNDSNPNIVYAGYYDIGFWYSLNSGASWKRSLPDKDLYSDYVWWNGGGSNCNFVLSDPERPEVVWATFGANNSSIIGVLFKSDEYGEDWQLSNQGLSMTGINMHGLSLDVNSPVNNRTLYLTQEGHVYKSTDDGNSWQKVLDNGGLKFTEVDKFNRNLVYAGGSNGFWRSTNAGLNWEEAGLNEMRFVPTIANSIMRDDIVPTYDDMYVDPPIEAWQGIFEIKADPNNENTVYATAYGPNKGFYKSTDAGSNWTKLYTNDKMRGIAIAPQNSNIVYTSSSLNYHSGGFDESSEGILMSEDAGQNWTAVNDGMAWTNGGRLEIETGVNPNIWAFSPGTGMQFANISAYITSTISIPNLDAIGVYPNPAQDFLYIQGKTTINSIKIISISGTVLLESDVNPGEQTISLEAIENGLYLIQINQDDWYKFVIQR